MSNHTTMTATQLETFRKLKFFRMCRKATRLYEAGRVREALIYATRLWNVIDHFDSDDDPEGYWERLARWCPWAFNNPYDLNSLEFTYSE